MIEELWKNSAIIAKRNVDSNQTPISVKLTELKQIIDAHSCVVLNQLPDESYGISIDKYTEVYDIEDITTKTFKVDYANGVIYFHPYNIGKNIVTEYYGTGCTLLSASRIYTKYDKYGNVLETLEELIDKVKLELQAVEFMGGAVEIITRVENANSTGVVLHENLVDDIAIADPLQKDLRNDINEANSFREEFNQDVQTGVAIKDEIKQNTIDAINVNVELEHSTEVAQEFVDIVRGTGNVSKIILTTDWTGTTPNLTYTWNHGLNTKNIIVNITDEDSSQSINPVYELRDNNNIIISSDTARKLRVVLSAQFYSGGMDTKDEIISARKGMSSLPDKITSIDTELLNLKDYLNYMPINGGNFDGNENNNVIIDGGNY